MTHKYLSLFLILLLTFLLSSCDKKDSTKTAENQKSITTLQQNNVLLTKALLQETLLSQAHSLDTIAEAIGKDLLTNQSFVLAYFLDKTYNASEITSAAARYKSLTSARYVTIQNDQGRILSTAGVLPQDDSLPNDTYTLDKQSNTLFYQSTYLLPKGGLSVTVGTTLSQEDITAFNTESNLTMIVQYLGLPLYITHELGSTIAMVDETHAISNGDTLSVESLTIDDNLSFLLFLDPLQ